MPGSTCSGCNFSHGTHDDHRALFDDIRRVESRHRAADRHPGRSARPEAARSAISPTAGSSSPPAPHFRLDLDPEPGDAKRAPLPHPEVFAALQPGTELLLDDGKVRLKVIDCGTRFRRDRVPRRRHAVGPQGRQRAALVLPISAVTEKDRADLSFALEHGADWVALSFVQRPEDVAEGRKLVGNAAGLMVKLEKPSAIRRLDEIIDLADALMVARGDLGVEMPPEDVPTVQKQIIHACRLAGKPVIVATQMLESMITAPTPTRAEASDVATAVYEGADAVMLSAETAVGAIPGRGGDDDGPHHPPRAGGPALFPEPADASCMAPEHTNPDAISAAACQVAATVGAAAIVSYTTSGATALRSARERPDVPILVLTSNLGHRAAPRAPVGRALRP